MLSRQPIRTLKQHACCQLLHMKMLGGNTTHEREAHYKAMAVISPVSHAHYLCCYSHYRWCWATHRPDFTCVATLSPAAVPQSEQARTNLSAVVVLAEEVPVSCPQEPAQLKLLSHSQLKGKLPLFSFWFKLTRTDSADLGSNSVYLHKKCITPAPFGLAKPKRICLFTVS